jgi:Icc-related predicted phosphoesterase
MDNSPVTRLQIISDLHVDVAPIKPITIADDVDLVISAGDTCEGALRAFEHLRRIVPMAIPIVTVMGNHEYYRRFLPDELSLARATAPANNIYLLENDAVVLGHVRFIGATLWTDYRLFGEALRSRVMSVCGEGLNDHRRIGWSKRPWLRFRPEEAALLHHRSTDFLSTALAEPFDGPTVVITHHAAHRQSIHPDFQDDWLSSAYASDLSELIERHRPALWVHGHVHRSFDYQLGSTRIICNAHGYGNENRDFDGSLVVAVHA